MPIRALAASAHAILLIVSLSLLAKVRRARVQCSWSDICFESPWSLRCIVIAPLLLSIIHLALFAVTIGNRGSPFEIVTITLALLAWVSCSASLIIQARPAASIDPQTEEKIRKVMRTALKHTTVLTIAHRVRSVADSDLIIGMDMGRVVEIGTPDELAKSETSLFSVMLRRS